MVTRQLIFTVLAGLALALSAASPEKRADHWAYQPVCRPTVPAIPSPKSKDQSLPVGSARITESQPWTLDFGLWTFAFRSPMSLLAAFNLTDAGWIVLGGLFGYAYVRYKERVRRQQLADDRRLELDAAKREAEALLREARVTANEEAIKLRSQA